MYTQLDGRPAIHSCHTHTLSLSLLLFEHLFTQYYVAIIVNTITIPPSFFPPLFWFSVYFSSSFAGKASLRWWYSFFNECYWQFIVIAHIVAGIRCEHWKWSVVVFLLLFHIFFRIHVSEWVYECVSVYTFKPKSRIELNRNYFMFVLHLKFNEQWRTVSFIKQFALLFLHLSPAPRYFSFIKSFLIAIDMNLDTNRRQNENDQSRE